MIVEPPPDARLRDLPEHAGSWAAWCCCGGTVTACTWLIIDGGLKFAAISIPFLAFCAWTDLTRRALLDPATLAVAVVALIAAALTGGLHLAVFAMCSGAAAWALIAVLRLWRGGLGAGDPPFIAATTCVLALLPAHPIVSTWASADLFRTLAKATVVLSALNAMLIVSLMTLGAVAVVRRLKKIAGRAGIPVATAAAVTASALLTAPRLVLWGNPYFWMS